MKVACSNAVVLLEGSVSAQPAAQMSSWLAYLHPKPFRVRSCQSSPFLISHIISSLLRALTLQITYSRGGKEADNTPSHTSRRSPTTRTHHTFLGVSFLWQEGDVVYSWQTVCV